MREGLTDYDALTGHCCVCMAMDARINGEIDAEELTGRYCKECLKGYEQGICERDGGV